MEFWEVRQQLWNKSGALKAHIAECMEIRDERIQKKASELNPRKTELLLNAVGRVSNRVKESLKEDESLTAEIERNHGGFEKAVHRITWEALKGIHPDEERDIQMHEGIVRGIARRYVSKRTPEEMLVIAGRMGLIKAGRKFLHEKGTEVTTYADKYILKEVQTMASGETGKRGGMDYLLKRRDNAEKELISELGRSPTTEEVYKRAGFNEEEKRAITSGIGSGNSIGLEETVRGTRLQLGDKVKDPNATLDILEKAMDSGIDLNPGVKEWKKAGLTDLEIRVMEAKKKHGRKLKKIAEEVGGIKDSKASSILGIAERKIRNMHGNETQLD